MRTSKIIRYWKDKNNYLNCQEKSEIDNLIEEYKDIFAKDKYDVGAVKNYEAHIDLLVEKYPSKRSYRLHKKKRYVFLKIWQLYLIQNTKKDQIWTKKNFLESTIMRNQQKWRKEKRRQPSKTRSFFFFLSSFFVITMHNHLHKK